MTPIEPHNESGLSLLPCGSILHMESLADDAVLDQNCLTVAVCPGMTWYWAGSPCYCLSRHDAVLGRISLTAAVSLFRVSFGSSKGSMVETLIYDCEPPPGRLPERDCTPRQVAGRRPAAARHSTCLGLTTAGGTTGLLPGPAARAPTVARPTGQTARPLSAPPRPTSALAR